MRFPEKHRFGGVRGDSGVFGFRRPDGAFFRVIASAGLGWDHVSVSVLDTESQMHPDRCPTWEEMVFVKNVFWDKEEEVIQFHPRQSEYVNNHEFVLHLWRPNDGREIPRPDPLMV